MPRKPRILTDSGIYHIVTRGNNKQKLFLEASDYELYVSLILEMKKEYNFSIYHYCLMTNHGHFLMRFYNSESLQKVMQRINLTYAKQFRKKYRYCGHVFQDRFKSFPIENDSYLLECGRYIERNPLKAGLVKDLTNYPWSSFQFYGYGKPNFLLDINPLYQELGLDEVDRKENYRNYVEIERPYERFSEDRLAKQLMTNLSL